MEVRRRFGLNVRTLRKAAGHTQEAFADKVGLARSYMSGIETGARAPTIIAAEKIAVALDVSICRLFLEPDATPDL